MKQCAFLLLLVPFALTGCFSPFGMDSIARSKSVGGQPPPIDPELPEVAETDESAPASNVITVKPNRPQSPGTETMIQKGSFSPMAKGGFSPVTKDQVNAANAHFMADRLRLELDRAE